MGKKAKRVYDENGNVTHKVCGKCRELKSINEFSVCKSKPDGHGSNCKECGKKYAKKYYEENKEQISEQKKKYGEENKEQISEQKKKYREENKEQINEYMKKYREENKEQIKEYKKKYYGENKEQISEHMKKYYGENKEQIKECKKKYYGENKERISEYGKKYREENKERISEQRKEYYESLCDEAITRIKTIVEQDPTRYDYKVGEEIYGVIYLVCCKPINKYYVGQTTIGFENRYSRGFFNDDGHRTKDDLKEDLEKYGEDSFEFTEIFKVAHNKEELDDLEVYYIDYFNSYYDGYNETRGNHHVK